MATFSSLHMRKKTIQRGGWLLALLIVAGSIAYPRPANWLLNGLHRVTTINFGQIQKPFVLGLDLQGGTHLEYTADVTKVASADRGDALNGVRDVIERRVNAMGVSEPLVQTQQTGQDWRVTVELAGIRDISQAIKMIGETPILEFKETNPEAIAALSATTTKSVTLPQPGTKKGSVTSTAVATVSGSATTTEPDVWKETKLTGKQLSSARVEFNQQNGRIEVALQFDSEGAKLFAEITKRNVGKPVAIFLDGQPISIPTVQGEILGGQAVISGSFSLSDAKLLATRLQAGALPVPIKLIAQQTVGPTLGADSLKKSLGAGLVGFLLVAIYMIVLYRFPGVVSIVALVLYAAVLSALFKLIPVTLTLSGIAGFILSLGIAVDANVLVFERLKEEWAEGKTLNIALEDAFKRAWLSIRDGHATVLISAVVLYWFSSSTIRGFAATLALGTLLSLFTAVVSTRTILRLAALTPIAKWPWLWLKKKEVMRNG